MGKRRDPCFSQYQISAVSWYGNDAEVMDYRESEDIQVMYLCYTKKDGFYQAAVKEGAKRTTC